MRTKRSRSWGGVGAAFASDSPEFSEIKSYVRSLPAPAPGPAVTALPPSDQLQTFANDRLEMQHPKNWSVYARGNAVTFAPEGGLQPDKHGNTQITYGLMINEFGTAEIGGKSPLLKEATRQLIEDLRRSNPELALLEQESRHLDGKRAIWSQLAGNAPTGRERVWVVTVWTQDGFLYFACVGPEREFAAYEPVFTRMLDSVRLLDQP